MTKQNKKINAVTKVVDSTVKGIASYFLVDTILNADNQITIFLAAFAGAWLLSETAVFLYNYVVKPVSKSILENS